MIRHFGYACQNMTLSELIKPKSKRVFTDRTLRLANFSIRRVDELILQNVKDLLKIIHWNKDHGIYFFRVGSNVFPFMDHPELKYGIDDLAHASDIKAIIARAGEVAHSAGMRLSSHPGPYTCLASPDEAIVQKSIDSLNMHSLMGDLLGHDEFVINIHVGGSYGGDFNGTADRFIANWNKLSDRVKSRLTIENDDKKNMWTVDKLNDLICKRINLPIVMDIHHHRLNPGTLSVEDALMTSLITWKGGRVPKIHYSDPRDEEYPQAHHDFVDGWKDLPDVGMDFDCMLEAKHKELALLRLRERI